MILHLNVQPVDLVKAKRAFTLSAAKMAFLKDITLLPTILVPLWIFTFISVAIVGARIYTRKRLLNAFGADDWWILAAGLCSIVGLVACTTILLDGDTNLVYLGADQACIAIYTMCDFFTRLSLLNSYLRITPRTCRWLRQLIQLFVGLVVAEAIFAVVMTVAPCWPPHFLSFVTYYKDLITGRLASWSFRCWRPGSLVLLVGSLGVFSNIIIFSLPYFLLRKASIKRDQRRTLYALFAFGGIVILLGIVRIPFLAAYSSTQNVHKVSLSGLCTIADLLMAEANCMILSACLPVLQPLVRRVLRGRPTESYASMPSTGHRERPMDRIPSRSTIIHCHDDNDPEMGLDNIHAAPSESTIKMPAPVR